MTRYSPIGASIIALISGRLVVIAEEESNVEYGKIAGALSVPMGRSDHPQETIMEIALREFPEETQGTLASALAIGYTTHPTNRGTQVLCIVCYCEIETPPPENLVQLYDVEDFMRLGGQIVRPLAQESVRVYLDWLEAGKPNHYNHLTSAPTFRLPKMVREVVQHQLILA